MGHDSNTGGGPRCGRRPSRRSGMPTLDAPDYTIARFVIERGLALIYAIAFLVAANQFPALSGERGLQPATAPPRPGRGSWSAPSLFHWGYSDRRLRLVAWAGIAIVVAARRRAAAAGAAAGDDGRLVRALGRSTSRSSTSAARSTASAGSRSCSRPGFLAIFLGNAETAPQWLVHPRVPLARVPGRVRGGADQAARRPLLARPACMDFHHETQPMPNPLVVVLPPPAAAAPPARGARQLRRPAGAAVRAVPAPAVRVGRGAC